MSQDFFRRIDGYNRPFFVNGNASLARDASLVMNAPAGPGRIEAFWLTFNDVNVVTSQQDVVEISVDGATLYLSPIGFLVLIYEKSPWIGPATAGKLGTSYVGYEVKLPIDYESSASVAISNTTSPNPTVFISTIYGRCGR